MIPVPVLFSESVLPCQESDNSHSKNVLLSRDLGPWTQAAIHLDPKKLSFGVSFLRMR